MKLSVTTQQRRTSNSRQHIIKKTNINTILPHQPLMMVTALPKNTAKSQNDRRSPNPFTEPRTDHKTRGCKGFWDVIRPAEVWGARPPTELRATHRS